MEFEQPELGQALRELAIERDASFASRRHAFVDYDGTGKVARINWPAELGAMPEVAAREAKVKAIRAKGPKAEPPAKLSERLR